MLTKLRKIILFVFVMISAYILSACGDSYTCSKCDETTTKAYYDMDCDEDDVMCEDCARKYWMPLDYKTYRVK